MEMNHILVVEDDKEIREGVKIYLQVRATKYFWLQMGLKDWKSWKKRISIWRSWIL